MSTPGKGHFGFFQLAIQGTWGTAVAATGYRYPLTGEPKLKPNFAKIEDAGLWGGMQIREVFEGGKFWEVELETAVNYQGMLKIYHLIMGTSQATGPTTPTVSGAVDSLYTHTFKAGQTIPFASIELMEGRVDGSANATAIEGFILEKMSITGKAGQSADAMLTVKLSGIARTVVSFESGSAPTSLSLVPQRPVYFHHASLVHNGSSSVVTDVIVKEWSLDIERPISRDRFAFGTSPYLLAPILVGVPSVVMGFVAEWHKPAARTAYTGNTNGAPRITFTSPLLVGVTSVRSMDFSIAAARLIDAPEAPISRFGILEESLKWKAIASTTDPTTATDLLITVGASEATIAAG